MNATKRALVVWKLQKLTRCFRKYPAAYSCLKREFRYGSTPNQI